MTVAAGEVLDCDANPTLRVHTYSTHSVVAAAEDTVVGEHSAAACSLAVWFAGGIAALDLLQVANRVVGKRNYQIQG